MQSYDMWLQSGNPLDEVYPCEECEDDERCKECGLCSKHCDCNLQYDLADIRYAEMKDNDYYVPWSV